MKFTVFLLAIFISFTFNFKVVYSENCECGVTTIKTCDELRKDHEYNDFVRAFDCHYLKHAYNLYGDRIFGTTPEDPNKKKDKSRTELLKLINQMLLNIDPNLTLPHMVKGNDYYDLLLKLITHMKQMKGVTCSTVTTHASKKPKVGVLKANCKSGFTKIGDICYFFSQKKLSWTEARDACKKIGTVLAHPLNDKENMNLVKHLESKEAKKGFQHWWIGGNDLDTEGKFKWDHDHSSVDFADWYGTVEPNNGGKDENCIEINATYEYQWNDNNCIRALNYICQQK